MHPLNSTNRHNAFIRWYNGLPPNLRGEAFGLLKRLENHDLDNIERVFETLIRPLKGPKSISKEVIVSGSGKRVTLDFRLMELRPGAYRIYFAYNSRYKYIIYLDGGGKSTQNNDIRFLPGKLENMNFELPARLDTQR